MSLTSSSMLVPLLLPEELRDAVLTGAAEIVVERGSRNRCLLHIYSEEERLAKVAGIADPADVVRCAHEKRLAELQWARGVLWAEPRTRVFLRYEDPRLWPGHTSLSKAVDVVRQLVLCEDGDTAAVLRRARDLASAGGILRREATQPGLHLLRETSLEGQATLYDVQQTRKRSRDASAATMPSVLSRVDAAPVDAVAWLAEMRTVSYAVSDVLQLQLAAAPAVRLVELLQPPSASPAAAVTPAAARQQWRVLLGRHRAWAEHQFLLADVEESCRGWGATELCVARDVQAALAGGASVQLRTGVHASVVHRRELVLLLSSRPRRLDGITAREQAALAACYPARSWSAYADEGLLRVVVAPPAGLAPAVLDTLVRQLFVSPALCDEPLSSCCTVGEVQVLSPDLRAVRLTSAFNPFVVLHGSRVAGGFAGDVGHLDAMQRDRDRLIADRTIAQLRHSLHDGPPRTTNGSAASVSGLQASPQQSPPAAQTRITGSAAVATFHRALIAALAVAPLSRAEIQQHPSMRGYVGAANYEAVLKAALKEHTEFRGRKYHIRD